jgi:prepilin-type N-terminal cleavage/methylation domain-containing protein
VSLQIDTAPDEGLGAGHRFPHFVLVFRPFFEYDTPIVRPGSSEHHMPHLPRARAAFSLVELLVVLAIIGILIAMLLPAVQSARESGARAQCQSNMHQLGVAVQHFHDIHGTMPTYFGTFPGNPSDVYPWDNMSQVYGGWFVHLLPFVEQGILYNAIADEIAESGWNYGYYDTAIGGTPGAVVVQQYNGHTYVYQETIGGTYSGYHAHGIWYGNVPQATFKILQCPSDPTIDPSGFVYGSWGGTNYLANYNAWTANPGYGVWAPPVRFNQITDGLTETVLFGEGYQTCDTIGRIALYSWYYHNFGLDWYQQANTNLFQDRPAVTECDNWRAQSGHVGGMNVCLFDASVRHVQATISQRTWTNALLPRDGNALDSDW